MLNVSLTSDIVDSIEFFQRLFQITVALALSESFKQFVAENKPGTVWKVHFERLPALLIFICVIVPFFHGMNRYFYLTYLREDSRLSELYALQLLYDSSAFLSEAACFFILSRALALEQLEAFLLWLVVLLGIDTAWSLLASVPQQTKWDFITLNGASMGVSLLALDTLRNLKEDDRASLRTRLWVAISVMCVNVIILIAGYAASWRWYFPLSAVVPSAQCAYWDVCDIIMRRLDFTSGVPAF